MLLRIIFAVAGLLMVLSLVYEKLKAIRKSPSAIFTEIGNPLYEPFDIEKECLKLQEERESREPYIITLWWGFDGLRLNEDGTTEWISRRKEQEKTKSSCRFMTIPNSVFENLQNAYTEQYALAQAQSAIACQNATLQSGVYAQCQNAPYPSYQIGNLPYMTSYAPYRPYCAGGNFGTYKY